jgi:hypothetical protein
VNTVYILGRKGFRYAVGRQLGKTCRACLPGELIDHDDDRECQLYWVPENLELVDFKRKITAFIIFKYRLQFFTSADDYWLSRSQQNNLAEEKRLLEEIRRNKLL